MDTPYLFNEAGPHINWAWARIWTWCKAHPLVPMIVLAAGLRIFLLGNAALWYDETGSVWMASLPWAKMIAATGGDTHPPLYFALLWGWVRLFGTSEAVVRIPSLIFSLLAIALTWKLGERFLGRNRPALVAAAALMAFNPTQLYFAQEARMYALFTVEILVALIAATDKRWWLLGLALAAGYWTQNYGLIFAVPINLLALAQIWSGHDRRENFAYWLMANVLAFASWAPWIGVLAGQMHDVSAGYWIPPLGPGAALNVLFETTWGLILTDNIQGHAALLICGALVFALGRAILRKDRGALVLALLSLSPLALAIVASQLWKPILLFRALMPIMPPLLLLFGWAFTEGLSLRGRLVAALLTVPILAGTLVVYYEHVAPQKGDPRIWTSAMVGWQPGDIIYHLNEGSYMALHFYTDRPSYMMPRGDWRNLGALSDRTKEAMGFQIAPLNSLTWRRAWFIAATGPTTADGEQQAIEAILARYPHEVVRLEEYPLSTFAMYLLFNMPPALGTMGLPRLGQ